MQSFTINFSGAKHAHQAKFSDNHETAIQMRSPNARRPNPDTRLAKVRKITH